MGARENMVERYLDQKITELGGLTRKWVSPGHVGVPDRLTVYKSFVPLIEVKTTDGKMSEQQIRECIRLSKAGAMVGVVYGKEGVDQFIKYLAESVILQWEAPKVFGFTANIAEAVRLHNAGFEK